MEPLFQVKNLTRVYTMGDEKVFALRDINMEIYRNEILCLLGSSGSGKSTLLNHLAGLDRPTRGEIMVNGKIPLHTLSEREITKFRQLNVGFVFQSYNLIPTLTAEENVSLGLIFQGVKKTERKAKADKILDQVGLLNRAGHKPSEMSGGQQQRVSIARAFINNPPILFADEPTGNLDSVTSIEIMELMCALARKHEETLIIVTHDLETAIYADRVVEMRDGEIISDQRQTPKTFDESKYI